MEKQNIRLILVHLRGILKELKKERKETAKSAVFTIEGKFPGKNQTRRRILDLDRQIYDLENAIEDFENKPPSDIEEIRNLAEDLLGEPYKWALDPDIDEMKFTCPGCGAILTLDFVKNTYTWIFAKNALAGEKKGKISEIGKLDREDPGYKIVTGRKEAGGGFGGIKREEKKK